MQNYATAKFLTVSAAYFGLPADQNWPPAGQSND